MKRQIFYLEDELVERLRYVAFKEKVKLSHLVSQALKHYIIDGCRKKPSNIHSILRYSGKISSFKNFNPLEFQRHIRKEWNNKK
jgi:hypothetical protein